MNRSHADLKTFPGETWQDALIRFKRLCHLDLDEYFDDDLKKTVTVNLGSYYDSGMLFDIINKEPAENIRIYEAKYGITIPLGLADLMCRHGAFAIYMVSLRLEQRWGERTFLEIYGEKDVDLYPNIKPICEAISFHFDSYFADGELSNEQVRYLNSNYFCFGFLGENDQEKVYLYFDRNHHFGSFRFFDEDYPENLKSLAPLLSASAAPLTLDSLLTSQIDRAIELMLEYSDVSID